MQLHQLKLIHKKKHPKRVGRGGKRGTYCGRGIKGQKARAGRRLKPVIRELIKKYHKLRGYKMKLKNPKSKFLAILNLDILEKRFNSGEKITPEILLERKIIRKIKGKIPKIKILGEGKLSKSLTVENCLVSKKAKEIIEKANGMVK